MKKIVISAVNIVEAGPLTILKDCLTYLSQFAENNNFEIIAIINRKGLIDLPNITYQYYDWPKKNWFKRIWFEYVSLKKISKDIGPVYLWVSLHDTSPSVYAEKRAVYCHNAFLFYNWSIKELKFAPKIALFAMLTRFIYWPNIKKNNYLIVQQEWLRTGLSKVYNLNPKSIIVSKPTNLNLNHELANPVEPFRKFTFIFPGSPNSHKNFDILCEATAILSKEGLNEDFEVIITISGNENPYAESLKSKWGEVKALNFYGFVKKVELEQIYQKAHCLVFPSKIESWGLPISEFSIYGKPMLLANLPYAKETAQGSQQVSFFEPNDANQLANQMKKLIQSDFSILNPVQHQAVLEPYVNGWKQLFNKLLND